MMALVIGIVLIVVGIAFAAAPFVRRAPGETPPDEATARTHRRTAPEGNSNASAAFARDGAPAARADAPRLAAELEELALDHAMGKLGDTDYARLREALLERARPASPSDRQVHADNAVRSPTGDARACPRCGPRPEPLARYCSRCGAPCEASVPASPGAAGPG